MACSLLSLSTPFSSLAVPGAYRMIGMVPATLVRYLPSRSRIWFQACHSFVMLSNHERPLKFPASISYVQWNTSAGISSVPLFLTPKNAPVSLSTRVSVFSTRSGFSLR